MKSSIKTLFVVLAIVMSFVSVQAVWAKGGEGPPCTSTTFVAGEVTELGAYDCAIVVGGVTIYGISPWVGIVVGDSVEVDCFVTQDDKYVACYLTIFDEEENPIDIDLRPRYSE